MILKIIYNMSIYKTLNNIQKEKGTQTITKKKKHSIHEKRAKEEGNRELQKYQKSTK